MVAVRGQIMLGKDADRGIKNNYVRTVKENRVQIIFESVYPKKKKP